MACAANMPKKAGRRNVNMRLPVFIASIAAVFMLGVGVTVAVMQYTVRIPSSAKIVVVAVDLTVWEDEACTQPCTSIDWGALSPGESKSLTVYMRNDGNVPVTLSMTVGNWNPQAAANYITLNWDYDGSPVSPGAVKPAMFTLTVSHSVSGVSSFSFEITITASG